ncbi:uncharacterized protein LOC106457387 [Limulus polyphemus]|uniref:Uncharacterized protein LOC106457387 n=1 Tax=Limulus polyphemus TaxID=6850 RepID=A0ABM1B0F9_LIMPO|nr:uncharacterized protein LOC106457387 [Limulus polyphemus]
MKYPRLVSSSTPASVQDWLEEELESRGIDGVYTRYILSLFQVDSFDLDVPECEHVSLKHQQNYKNLQQVGKQTQYTLPSTKVRHKRWKSWERERFHKQAKTLCTCNSSLNIEERKKCAAVECLKSACEQKSGIEMLVEELCLKLKNVSKQAVTTNIKKNSEKTDSENGKEQKSTTLQEQAQKYYAAFPSLSGKSEPQTKLCPQQERQTTSKCVWDGRKIIQHAYETAVFKLEESIVNMKEDNRSETKVNTQKNSGFCEGEERHTWCHFIGGTEEKCTDPKIGQRWTNADAKLENWKPSFIVPKMKYGCSRVPLSLRYSPFNIFSNIQENPVTEAFSYTKSGFLAEDECPKKTTEVFLDDKENVQTQNKDKIKKLLSKNNSLKPVDDSDMKTDSPVALEQWKLSLGSGEFSISECEALDKQLLNNLVNKFNDSVAAIWGKNEDMPGTGFEANPQQVELSLKMFTSMLTNTNKLLTPETMRGNLNPIQGSSVWSAGYDDLIYLNMFNASSLTHFYIPSLHRNLAAGIISGIIAARMGLENSPCNFENHQLSDLYSSIHEDSPFHKGDIPDDKELDEILSLHPDAFLKSLEQDDGIVISSNDNSRQESPIINYIGSEANVWGDTPDLINQQLESHNDDCWFPFLSAHNTFDVFSSLFDQHLECKDCLDLQNWGSCTTLTHHKGESKFVEVVPSNKIKKKEEEKMMEILNDSFRCSSEWYTKVEEEDENLLTSPRTHFQPIKDECDADNSGKVELLSLSVKQNENLPDFFPALSITNKEQTQDDHGLDSRGFDKNIIQLEHNSSPQYGKQRRRTISSSFEELVSLTGAFDLEENESGSESLNDKVEIRVSSSLSRTTELYEDKGTNTEINSFPQDVRESGKLWEEETANEPTIYSPHVPDINPIVFKTDEEVHWEHIDNTWKWSTNDCEKTAWISETTEIMPDLEAFLVPEKSRKFHRTCLNQLREEIEAEEEELLRDITRVKDKWEEVIDMKTESEFQDCSVVEDIVEKKARNYCEEDYIDTYAPFATFYLNPTGAPCESYQKYLEDWNNRKKEKFKDYYSLDVEDQDDAVFHSVPSLPAENVFFSCDLEEEWRKDSSYFGVQVPRRKKPKSGIPPQKRPCTFYLEGSCRRKDCKFSHDLAGITCRFWEESSCFKGVTCPFLHGYPSPTQPGIERMTSSKHSFTLESENDFPSLSVSASRVNQESQQKTIGDNLRMRRKRSKNDQEFPLQS